jgi:UDP-N-acetylglucosamine 2-epimerase (non-hydrolysing)
VGHVEAGLRTHNLNSPWPEEANRQLADRISTFYFAPTEISKENLLQEGFESENILVSGNTVIDLCYKLLKN